MNKTCLLIGALLYSSLLFAQPGQYFFQKLDCDLASTMCFDADSNIWIGCQRDDQPLLLKVSRDGVLLDQVLLNIPYGNNNILTELLIDSEGMLLGCGTMEPSIFSQPESSFAFRYDPAARAMLWNRKLSHGFLFAYGILESKPGGNFTVYGYNSNLQSTADILMLDRQSGDILPAFNYSYQFGAEEAARAAVYHEGQLYVTGRNDLGSFTIGQYIRQGLWRIDSSGAPVWALLGSVPDNKFAALLGQDILVEQNAIISLSSGNELSQNWNQAGHVFLQKTSLAGDLLWFKKFDVTDFGYSIETGYDLISVSDGFMIYGGAGDERDFLLKTDKNGNLLWAKGLKSTGTNLGTLVKPQSRMLADGQALYMVSLALDGNQRYPVLIKTDLNANIPGCDRVVTLVAVEAVPASSFFDKKTLIQSTSTASSETTVTELLPTVPMNFGKFCENEGITPQDPCQPSTFLQQLGEPGQVVNINSLAASPKGGICLAAEIDGKPILAALDAGGALQWSRQLPLAVGDSLRITAIMFDSDSMLAGCGYYKDVLGQRNRYVFRFDPDSAQLLWASSFSSLQPDGGGIFEIKTGGNYLVYHNLKLTDGRQVPETVQFDRYTGNLIALTGRRYDFDFGDQIYSSMVASGPSLFAVGEYSRFAEPRMALTRINSDFGGLNWARLSHADTAIQAPSGAYGSICMDGNNVVTAYAGFTPGAPNPTVFLQKTTPFGVIVWVREFKVSPLAFGIDLIAVPGGFVIMVKTDPASYALFRTDENGNLLVAKTFQIGAASGGKLISGKTQHLIILQGQHLFFALHDKRSGFNEAYLLKTDLDLNVAEPCTELKDFSPGLGYVIGPVSVPITEGVFVTPLSAKALSLETLIGEALAVTQQCPPVYNEPELDLGPDQTICSADSTILSANGDFESYLWQDGSTSPSLVATTSGLYILEVTSICKNVQRDTLVLTVEPNPGQVISYTLGSNFPINIGGLDYFAPDTVMQILPSGTGFCDTLLIYTLGPCEPIDTALTLSFYPGQSITLDGISYDQPGMYTHTLKNIYDCDSVVTYTLEWISTNIDLTCPADISATTVLYQNNAVVNYNPPTATTDCPDPDLSLTLLSGLPSGSAFPLGKTQVCYEMANACGIRETCCFTVDVALATLPCDVKTLPGGCLQIELLGIQLDSLGNRRYTIRFLNKCATALDYLAVQLPKGVTAVAPANDATYTATSGNSYTVRNPNFSPFYSIRFRASTGSLSNGASDIFEYSLPQQVQPDYLHVYAKLADGSAVETHLSALGCAPQLWNVQNRGSETPLSVAVQDINIWPNPTSSVLFVDLRPWLGQRVDLQIANKQGQVVYTDALLVEDGVLHLPFVSELPAGLYHFALRGTDGVGRVARFVVSRR